MLRLEYPRWSAVASVHCVVEGGVLRVSRRTGPRWRPTVAVSFANARGYNHRVRIVYDMVGLLVIFALPWR